MSFTIRQAFLSLLILPIFLQNAIIWQQQCEKSMRDFKVFPSFHFAKMMLLIWVIENCTRRVLISHSKLQEELKKIWRSLIQTVLGADLENSHLTQTHQRELVDFSRPLWTIVNTKTEMQHKHSSHRDKMAQTANLCLFSEYAKVLNSFINLGLHVKGVATCLYCTANINTAKRKFQLSLEITISHKCRMSFFFSFTKIT